MKQIKKIPKLQARAADSHKGDYGRVLVIGGSVGMAGAVGLAGKAALRSGAGLVTVAVPREIQDVVSSYELCYMTMQLELGAIVKSARDFDAIAFGPGIGVSIEARRVLEWLIRQDGLRIVVDADGLNNLVKITGWEKTLKAKLVLTPNPGEMKRLWQSVIREPMPVDRIEQAVNLAIHAGTVVVLKGNKTVVSDGYNYYVNNTGNPGMATGGSGDVLAGVVAALIGQGLSDFDASVLGVYGHGKAGDRVAERCGEVSMIASDIIDEL